MTKTILKNLSKNLFSRAFTLPYSNASKSEYTFLRRDWFDLCQHPLTCSSWVMVKWVRRWNICLKIITHWQSRKIFRGPTIVTFLWKKTPACRYRAILPASQSATWSNTALAPLGLEDLITTATSENSHHHELGRKLARGESDDITGEGPHTLKMINHHQLFDTRKHQLFQLINTIVRQPRDVRLKFQNYLEQLDAG